MDKIKEEWELEGWNLTIYPFGEDKSYIVSKEGEIKIYHSAFHAMEALCKEYPVEED